MNTPAFGTPLWARKLDEELKAHTKDDHAMFTSLQRGQTELQVETGKQTVMLVELLQDRADRRDLDKRRAGTELELASKTKAWWRQGAIGAVFAALGWLAHHFLG